MDLVSSVRVKLYFEFNMSILFYLFNDDIFLLCETKKISINSLAMKDLGTLLLYQVLDT